jgi:hypothetical protein
VRDIRTIFAIAPVSAAAANDYLRRIGQYKGTTWNLSALRCISVSQSIGRTKLGAGTHDLDTYLAVNALGAERPAGGVWGLL